MSLGARATSAMCSGCGLIVPGGIDGCQAIFDELLTRDFTNAAYFRVHRMMVDTYSLQHPDRYCVSPKSLAAHLAGLCWLLERGGCRAVGGEALRGWLDGRKRLEKPMVPSFRGELTVADARAAPDPEGYARAVHVWARSTWDAYSDLHELAREWIRLALAAARPARR